MKSLKEWRVQQEAVASAITSDPPEPDSADWMFYQQKIQGRAKNYLKWLTEELEGTKLNIYRKGFILQEIMDALGLDIGQVVKITTNIKRSLQKRNSMLKTADKPVASNPAPTPTPAPTPAGSQAGSMTFTP